MGNNMKKMLVIVPMIFLLCMSFIGITAKAEDKTNQTATVSSSDQTQKSDNDNKTNAIADAANVSGTNASDKNQNQTDGKNNQNLSTDKNPGTKPIEVLPAWKEINGKYYYVTKDGVLKKTGWFKEKDENPNANNDNVYYLDEHYSALIGWKKIDNSWYYFNETGIKQTGWKLINYEWYYLDENGVMQKGWIKDKGNKYYLSDYGPMTVGKKYIDNKWYFFGQDGSLQTGFYTNKGKAYCSTDDGEMIANEWVTTKNNKYYIKADSGVTTGYAIIDNEAENFDADGRYIGSAEMKNHLFIKYLNVGTADCEFIKLPNGETALIDTGTPETSKDVVSFLKDQNLKQENNKGVIDYIIITHGHSDHIGGLASILDNFNVKKVYMPDNAKMQDWYSNAETTASAATVKMLKDEYEVYNDAVKAMKDKNMQFTNTKKGEFIDKDKILQFIQSDKNFGGIGSEQVSQYYWGINENSAIIYLNYGDLQGLFTADMEWTSEKDFWTNNLLNGRKVNLLKVPHHGNDTSSTPDFLNYIKAPVGIVTRAEISNDQKNAFGNLLAGGVSIYKTGATEDGISIYATPENWTLEEKKLSDK